MASAVSLIHLDFKYFVIRDGEFLESEYQAVPALPLDFGLKVLQVNGVYGRFLLDGVLAFLQVTLEAFHKLDVVINVGIVSYVVSIR